jgi:hypothetical protein
LRSILAADPLDRLDAAWQALAAALSSGQADLITAAASELEAATDRVAAIDVWRSDTARAARLRMLSAEADRLARRVRMLTLLQQGRVEHLTRLFAPSPVPVARRHG